MSVVAGVTSVTASSAEVVLTLTTACVRVTDVGTTATRITVTQLTCRVVEVSGCTLCTVSPTIVEVTLTLATLSITVAARRADAVTATCFALWESIVAISALLAVVASKVGFAGTLAAADLTNTIDGAINEALTLLTPWPAKVTRVASLAALAGILGFTDALSGAVLTVAGAERVVTAAPSTRINRILGHAVRAVVPKLALFTVNALRVVLAILTDAAALVVAVDVDGFAASGHVLVIVTLIRVAIAITRFTFIRILYGRWLPWLLHESWAASVTLRSTSVVATATQQTVPVQWVGLVTHVGMTIAHAAPTNTDVLYRVVVPPSDCGVLPGHGHQVAQQSLRA
jgi:hypothetical protein